MLLSLPGKSNRVFDKRKRVSGKMVYHSTLVKRVHRIPEWKDKRHPTSFFLGSHVQDSAISFSVI